MDSIKQMLNDNEAVSETLGYILLFAIALSAIAIILLVGNSIISGEKTNDNFQNMVQNFVIVQGNLNQVALDGTPIETTMIHMDSGTLGLNTSSSRIVVDYDTTHYNNTTGQIIFTQENDLLTNVSLEDGGIWQASEDYNSIVSEPRMYITPNTQTLVLNIYRLTASNSSIITNAGSGTVNVGLEFVNTTVLPIDNDANGSATLTIYTNYPDAWYSYLSSMTVGVSRNVSFTDGLQVTIPDVSKLVISEHWVKVTFSGIYSS